jgi:hypothetical protein
MSLLQNRTAEFHTLTTNASKRMKLGGSLNSHNRLLEQEGVAGGHVKRPRNARGEFARRAAEIGKSITSTMGKLERLAVCMFLSFFSLSLFLFGGGDGGLILNTHSGKTQSAV